MEGRKLLEARLQKKEASLLQLRQLLERAQESHDRQRQKWQEQIRHLEGTVQKLTEKLNTDASVLPPLQAQCEQLQSRLTQTETEKRKLQAEVFSLRSKLGEAQITASQLREKVKQLESDLESRKSVWEKVAGLLHKKPSGKD
jgi:chromosome segregation ATPase